MQVTRAQPVVVNTNVRTEEPKEKKKFTPLEDRKSFSGASNKISQSSLLAAERYQSGLVISAAENAADYSVFVKSMEEKGAFESLLGSAEKVTEEAKQGLFKIFDYLSKSLKSLATGKDVTVLSTATDIGVGFIPVAGAVPDVRDVIVASADFLQGKDITAFDFGFPLFCAVLEVLPNNPLDMSMDVLRPLLKAADPVVKEAIETAIEKCLKNGDIKRLSKVLDAGINYFKRIAGAPERIVKTETKRLIELMSLAFVKLKKTGNVRKIADNLSDDVFESVEDFYMAIRKHPDDLPQLEINEIKRIRESLFAVKDGEEMVKVFPHTVDGSRNLDGFVLRKSDLMKCENSDDVYNMLRLDYDSTEFVKGVDNYHVVEFKADVDNIEVPYGQGKMGGAVSLKENIYPFSGNGFIASKGDVVPEYKMIEPLYKNTYGKSIDLNSFLKGMTNE